ARHPEGDGPIVIASAFEEDIAWNLKQAGLTDVCAFRDSSRHILCEGIYGLLPEGERFTLLDVGARDAVNDERWLGIPASRMRLYGFELDDEGCEAMNREMAESGIEARFFPYGLAGAAGRRSFHHSTRHPGSSSLYPYNMELFGRIKMADSHEAHNLAQFLEPIESLEVQVSTLDQWKARHDVASVDFMKLNVQGAELEILQGGESLLPEVLGLFTEAAFVESYVGRPLFADLDRYLRSQGFTFFTFIGPMCMGRNASPVTTRHLPSFHAWHGQLIEAHALYLRDPIAAESRGQDMRLYTKANILKLAALAERHCQTEFAFEVLAWAEQKAVTEGDHDFAAALRALIDGAARSYQERFK
ncbi:MAG TPA: FkbM family methyltransferase, partial [Humidesulfovibrio sp.]|uniref:FkbM family methyltransferase n=1 Tax=Humidesulfovibrio sp. TaxID=2910988 RepID=UPI002B679D47